jgi:hypothetical protein
MNMSNTNSINNIASLPYFGSVSDSAAAREFETSAADKTVTDRKIYSSNAMLIGHTDDKTEDDFDIALFERQLDRDLGDNAKIINECDIADIPGSVPDTSRLQEIFTECANDENIPWDYLRGGCENRAHFAADKFIKEGYNCAKIFVKVDQNDNSDVLYKLKAENQYSKGEWTDYHTAALVFAEDENSGIIDGYIIDPSIDNQKPLKPDEWIKQFRTQDIPISIDITQADVRNPPATMTYGYSLVNPREFSMEKFDKEMNVAVKKNEKILNAFEEIKKAKI